LSIFTYFFQRSVTGNNFGVPAQLSSSSSPSSRSAFDEPPPPPPGLLHVDRIADCEWVSRGSSALCALTAALLEEELFKAAAAITAGGGGKLDSLFNCLNHGVPSLSPPAAAAEEDDEEEEEAKARASSSGVSAAVEMGAAAGAS
jgi:hypothetical protein